MDVQIYRSSQPEFLAGRQIKCLEGPTEKLSPGLFYPMIPEKELVTWTHWLPTCLTFTSSSEVARKAFVRELERLAAPQEIVDECQWSWSMGLFEAYELRTPEHRSHRDPLVLGRLGSERYRIALWGESLRPFEEVNALVEESLAIRHRATSWQLWLTTSGALLGMAVGLWMAMQVPSPVFIPGFIGMGATFGAVIGRLPFHLDNPENRQQRFLDRYRS